MTESQKNASLKEDICHDHLLQEVKRKLTHIIISVPLYELSGTERSLFAINWYHKNAAKFKIAKIMTLRISFKISN